MQARLTLLFAALSAALGAQTPCAPTPVYGRCELVWELNSAERAAHPSPWLSVNLRVEFRSPRHRTQLMPAFWDGEGRMVVRFAPTDVGEYEYHVSSNVKRFDGAVANLTATESTYPGFIIPANGHHWRYTEGQAAHLWMGVTAYDVAAGEDAVFRETIDGVAAGKFNHLRGYAVGRAGTTVGANGRPDVTFFRKLDERIGYVNSKGITFDMIVSREGDFLAKQFPTVADRERWLRYLVARYSAFNITWELTEQFESIENGRQTLKQMGQFLKATDPYNHPRSAHAAWTSAPLLPDGWMDHILYGEGSDEMGAIEHQLYAVPSVNTEPASGEAGADEFRHRLWKCFLAGQYPTLPAVTEKAAGPDRKAMAVWYDLIAGTRHWELEPFFDLDGGRAMALPDVEYIVYVEKPAGPVEVRVEKHEYDVRWIDPASGETVPIKSYKFDKFTGEPPSADHDWILHISREGHKEGMLRSWKFESIPFQLQEPESASSKVPFEVGLPAGDEVSQSKAARFAAKLKRDTRGTRSMVYLWTGDVPVDGQGYRVLGVGAEGVWHLDPNAIRRVPGIMNMRLYGMNANGKVYLLDRIYRVVP